MKTIILIILLPLSCFSQRKDFKWWLNRYKVTAPLVFTAGVADGNVEIITHKFQNFQRKWKNADPNKWNPNITWKNKWKNGDRSQGEKFPLSSTLLVATTDPYHALRTYEHIATSVAVIIPIRGKRQKTYVYIIDFLVINTIKMLGFSLTYDFFYKG